MSEDDELPKFLLPAPAPEADPAPEPEAPLEVSMEDEFAAIDAEVKARQAAGDLPPSYGDWIENVDGESLSARHREVARMLAKGLRNKDVCLRLGYTPGRVSVLLKNSKIREEILRFQDRIFDKELSGRLEEIGPDAMDVIEKAIRSETMLKPSERVETAKWAMEKLTGKAIQKHEVESGTLGRLLDKLDTMQDMKEVLDAGVQDKDQVTEADFTVLDPIDAWAKDNLD